AFLQCSAFRQQLRLQCRLLRRRQAGRQCRPGRRVSQGRNRQSRRGGDCWWRRGTLISWGNSWREEGLETVRREAAATRVPGQGGEDLCLPLSENCARTAS